MNNKLVSIITPCYNSAKYIGQMIESVQSQTYTNWELLITDDCSTDNSKEIIDSYIKSSDIMIFISINGNCLRISESNNMKEDLVFKDKMIISSSKVYDCHAFREKVKKEKAGSADIKQDVVDEVMKHIDEMHEKVETEYVH